MNLSIAFWTVINKIFRWRPIVLGCCDCNATYYLTKNVVMDIWEDEDGNRNPVVDCPNCGLRHCVLFVRIDPEAKAIKYETVYDEE